MALRVVWLVLLASLDPLILVWSMACPSMCTCRYKGGKETAECISRRLVKVPFGLSRGTQVLDISKNNLKQLVKEEFFHAGLLNLQKLYVAECKIRKIDDGAFSHLANLVELDLEGNLLISVPSETFEDYPELRRLNLNNNPIRRIETLAFVKLPYLSDLEMSNCFVDYVGPRAFTGLEVLQDLRLNGNHLTTLPSDIGFPIKSLRNLQVYDNPWVCDCHLRVFRNWLVDDGLPVSSPPICAEPPRLQSRPLGVILPEEFACPPQASAYQVYMAEAYLGEGAKLVCNVQSDPPADIRWTFQGKLLTNYSKGNSKVHVVQKHSEVSRMSILTVSSASYDDSGEYLCIADNLAGQVVINMTLDVSERTAEASSLSNGHIAGISIGLIVISVVTVVFICVLLTKMRRQNQQSDERKHLELVDKKQSVQLVNHSGSGGHKEIIKARLTVTSTTENSKKTMTNSSSGGATPTAQEMFRLEDSIGGSLIRSSSRMSSNKPDVVNFTCSTTAGGSSPEESSATLQQLDNHNNHQMKCSNSNSKISPVIENIKDSIRLMTSSKDMLTDSRERLCEYVQLYEEAEQHGAVQPEDDVGGDARRPLDSNESSVRGGGGGVGGGGVGGGTGTVSGEINKSIAEPNNVKQLKNGARTSAAAAAVAAHKQRYGPLGNACGGILKHVNLHGRNYVPVLPPLPVHHFAQVRDSPDEGYEDEVEDEMDT